MLPLLAALVLSQGPSPLPVWAVAEFQDLKAGKYGPVAARMVAERLTETKAYDVLPDETVRRAMATLDLSPPLVRLVDLSRVGTEAFNNPAGGGTIVAGEVVDYRIDRVRGGRQARLALRVVAYDVASVLPVNGALELGLSSIRKGRVKNDELLTEALQQAAGRVVSIMRDYKTPSASVIETRTRTVTIDRGTREGFRSGDIVVLTRGPILIGGGKVGAAELDRAELVFERIGPGIAPGDRVRRVFTPPPLPPAAPSIFGGKP